MTDQEERSGRKRARGDEDEHQIQRPLRWVPGKLVDYTGAPVSQKDFDDWLRSIPAWMQGLVLKHKERLASMDHELGGRRQGHVDGEEGENWDEEEGEEEEEEEENAEEEHERPARKRRRIRGAGSLSPDRGDPDEAVPEWFDSTAGSDVDLEATNSQARLLSHEGRQDDPTGDDGTSLNRGEGSEDDEVMEKRVVRRQQGELVPISSKKTRTKTTTTTRTGSDGTTTTTVTKRTTKVSRKRFERR
ncbi:hypothetical protein CGCS363_v006409 [Colletotrichum siamense]|uniref:uncharacterized protein n=1 Tax=Colletotrichum siamense TaxID=690259 RepID=UPI001872625D|nr:uncharacterized protein CGCS363_v006409 [Colletotrichum siamense]KAF5500853.1 hypothetical protein CGCS363_v006409 [Colletotrichum siamense]